MSILKFIASPKPTLAAQRTGLQKSPGLEDVPIRTW
jgi:hypothetical protein